MDKASSHFDQAPVVARKSEARFPFWALGKAALLSAFIGAAVASCGDGSGTADVDTIQQGWGEPTCCTIQFDAVLPTNTRTVTSPTASYGHPGCTHTYIAEGSASSPDLAFATYEGPPPTTQAACTATRATVALYRRIDTASGGFGGASGGPAGACNTPDWEKVGEITAPGSWIRGSSCILPIARVHAPVPGTYYVMGQAKRGSVYERVREGFGRFEHAD
jgi:hypothetical protein